MSFRIVSTYTPLYPPNPINGDIWTDPNTGYQWYYFDEWLLDPYWNDVVLLLHMEGSNGSMDIIDSSTYGATLSDIESGSNITTSAAKYGASSFDTSFDTSSGETSFKGIIYTDLPQLDVGTGDFTVEFYLNLSAQDALILFFLATITEVEVNQAILYSIDSAKNQNLIYYEEIDLGNYSTITTSSTAISDGVWQHHALVKSGSTITMYLDGVSTGSGPYPSELLSNNFIFLGTAPLLGTPGSWISFTDELRITKGIARYTSNFTPPTSPFPDYALPPQL